MTTVISAAEFETLVEHSEPGSVSLYMPTHRAGFATQQDPIRFKNLLGETEERLLESGWRRQEAQKRLSPLRLLLDDGRFWQNQRDGLALFYGTGEPLLYRVPLHLPELTMVGERYYLKPLLPFLDQKMKFYLLAISQGSVRLFVANRFEIGDVTPQDMPRRIKELAEAYETDRVLQRHPRSPPQSFRGERASMFHGHGGAPDEDLDKRRMAEFCQEINKSVLKMLRGNGQMPLVLAATEPLLGVYRQTNSYPFMEEQHLHGNPEDDTPQELHRKALPIVEPYYRKDRQAAVNQYRRLVEARLASDDLKEVLAAAHKDQIATVFVSVEDEQWGRFNPETFQAEIHDGPQAGDRDLLDLATFRSFLSGSVIYPCARHELPSQTVIAATYRFSTSP